MSQPQQHSDHIDLRLPAGSGYVASYDWKRAEADLSTAKQKARYFSRDTYVQCAMALMLRVAMILGSFLSGGFVLGILLLPFIWVEPMVMLLIWLKIPAIRGAPKFLILFLALGVDVPYLCTWIVLYYWDATMSSFVWWTVTVVLGIHAGFSWQSLVSTTNVQHAILTYHLIKTHLKNLNLIVGTAQVQSSSNKEVPVIVETEATATTSEHAPFIPPHSPISAEQSNVAAAKRVHWAQQEQTTLSGSATPVPQPQPLRLPEHLHRPTIAD